MCPFTHQGLRVIPSSGDAAAEAEKQKKLKWEEYTRKAEILMEILNAGEAIEEKIAAFRHVTLDCWVSFQVCRFGP